MQRASKLKNRSFELWRSQRSVQVSKVIQTEGVIFKKFIEKYIIYIAESSTKTRRYNRSISITNHQIYQFSSINKQNQSLFIHHLSRELKLKIFCSLRLVWT